MAVKFVLLVNKQGQTRVAQYYEYKSVKERAADEAEMIRKCLARNENQVRCAVILRLNAPVSAGRHGNCRHGERRRMHAYMQWELLATPCLPP